SRAPAAGRSRSTAAIPCTGGPPVQLTPPYNITDPKRAERPARFGYGHARTDISIAHQLTQRGESSGIALAMLLHYRRLTECPKARCPNWRAPMSLAVTCPSCQTKLRVRDELAGKEVKCPRCSLPVTVPAEDPVELPVEAVQAETPGPKRQSAGPTRPCP